MNIEKFLKRVFLFSELTDSELKSIAAVASTKTLRKNQALFNEDDDAKFFFIIAYGKVKILRIKESGTEHVLHILKDGELVAEAAIFNEKKFPASCVAIEDTLVVYIPREEFINLILNKPRLSLKFMSAYSKRLREFVQQIEHLSNADIKQRLSKYILENVDKRVQHPTLKLSITKKDLAYLLGTVPETLSRALANLKKKGYIDVSGSAINVINIKGLESLL